MEKQAVKHRQHLTTHTNQARIGEIGNRIANDGNCLFNSFYYLLHEKLPSQQNLKQLREQHKNYIENNFGRKKIYLNKTREGNDSLGKRKAVARFDDLGNCETAIVFGDNIDLEYLVEAHNATNPNAKIHIGYITYRYRKDIVVE